MAALARIEFNAPMDRLMTRCAKWLLVLALVASVGGHWMILQGVAWSTMLVRFAQSMPLVRAVACTFDGDHPCALCLVIKEGKKSEKKSDQESAPTKQLDWLLQATPQFVCLGSPPPCPDSPPAAPHVRCEPPPVPPPRVG
jgi:hypothetical protein